MANEALEPPILSHAHIQHTSGALKSRAFKLTFLCLCLCNFISTLDSVIIATSLPAIAHALDATSIEAYWCGSAFLFAQAVSQPLYGAFSETFGRKLCLIIALTTFTAFSLLCALAQNITWLIIARVVGSPDKCWVIKINKYFLPSSSKVSAQAGLTLSL